MPALSNDSRKTPSAAHRRVIIADGSNCSQELGSSLSSIVHREEQERDSKLSTNSPALALCECMNVYDTFSRHEDAIRMHARTQCVHFHNAFPKAFHRREIRARLPPMPLINRKPINRGLRAGAN